jgi:hypothetical protein
MWHVGMSKRGDGEIIYEPPAGPTIKEAINNAIEIAQEENKPVELHLNDIILTVNQGSKVESIAAKYFLKLERKYRQPYNATYHKGIIR